MSGTSEEGKFRSLIKHMALEGCFDAPQALLEYAYWLTGRAVVLDKSDEYWPSMIERDSSLDDDFERYLQDMVRFEDDRPEGTQDARKDDYPELYRYYHCGDTEARQIERDAARMFCDALLSRDEVPAGEGWAYAKTLARWAYGLGCYDKVNALNRRGKLFTPDFPPFVTMDDRPDYPTLKQWDDEAVKGMDEFAIWRLATEAALEVDYDGSRFDYWYPLYEARGIKQDQPVKVCDIVALVRFMQQEGMKRGVTILSDYVNSDSEIIEAVKIRDKKTGEFRTVKGVKLIDPGYAAYFRERFIRYELTDEDYSDGYWRYFKSAKGVDGEYADFLDRRNGDDPAEL